MKQLAPGGNAYTGRYVLGECKDGSYTKDIRIPALKALGELVSAEARVYTDVCLLSGIVPAVMKMLRHVDHAQARKEGCWLVSNLLAALPDQVLAAIMPFDLSVKSSLNPVEKPTDDDKPLPEPEEEVLTSLKKYLFKLDLIMSSSCKRKPDHLRMCKNSI